MAKAVRSAKGVEVNFDLINIKREMAAAPKPMNVIAREDFIDQKARRRLKKLQRKVTEQVAGVNVEPKNEAQPEGSSEELIDETVETPEEQQ